MLKASSVCRLMLSMIDHESFLAFGVALTFFTLGVVGIIGSDDILCCFVVGNSFTWDDWFRAQTEDHSFQDVIDQLLNSVCDPCMLHPFAHLPRQYSYTSARSFHGVTLQATTISRHGGWSFSVFQ